jgi:predicted NUDIX family NTP pyrophosphohydrolase
MTTRSAGLLMFRRRAEKPEVLLVHPGGPYWARKDDHAWSIPKGGIVEGEDPLDAAKREFKEETGWEAKGPFHGLGQAKQRNGKIILAWAFEGNSDPATLCSNTFSMEWPPRSGRMQEFPEVDRASWFDLAGAKRKVVAGQARLIDELERLLAP